MKNISEIIDYRTKQRVCIPKKEQIIYKDESIPAIVSEELWNRAGCHTRTESGRVLCNYNSRRNGF